MGESRFRGTVAPVPQEIEEVTETFGIPNTEVFQSMENGGNNFNYNNNNNVGGFRTPGTGEDGRFQSPSGNYVTNRVNSGGYIPGLEPEENYLSKIAKTAGRGIMGMIPGGSLMMGFADKLDRFDDLSPFAQEYTRQQMANQEANIHGTTGMEHIQDRYGYNKRSALGDYDALVAKRIGIAEKFKLENGYYRDIDNYYLDKGRDKDTLKSQLDMNDIVRNRAISNKLRSGDPKNNPSSSDYQPVGPNSPPAPTTTNNDRGDPGGSNDGQNNAGDSSQREDDSWDSSPFKKGGRVGYYFGGLAARGMKR